MISNLGLGETESDSENHDEAEDPEQTEDETSAESTDHEPVPEEGGDDFSDVIEGEERSIWRRSIWLSLTATKKI